MIVIFFGDHQPDIEQEWISEIHGGSLVTLDEQMERYMVPFFVWANYDIEEQFVECTGIHYLANYLFEISDLPEPPYNRFLRDISKTVPAINPFGFFSAENGGFITVSDAENGEKDALSLHQILQYNNVFDKKNLSAFFTVYDNANP